MRICAVVLVSLFVATYAKVFPQRKVQYLGEKECTYGPSYWCEKLTNAADCRATKHCIQTVWIHKKYPEDKTSICDTCKEMVKEARDQLESNETQELIKEVFEGSCALLRLKPIVKECDKIADNYIPDLIDTLASEMDPQTVCAVAGLCNSARIHQLLEEAGEQVSNKPTEVAPQSRCDNCNTVMEIVVKKFNDADRSDFLDGLLEICGKMSSFSDACTDTVITNFNDIYTYLKQNLNAGDFCLLSGECYTNFHKHEIEITPKSKIGYVPIGDDKDDLPCELCKQLVNHLRDILIANTTEAEFKQVLEGICKQAKPNFSKECLTIVNQYYDLIYNYIVADLNSTILCDLIKICPNGNQKMGPFAPLLPVESVEKAVKLSSRPELEHVYVPKDDIVVRVMKPKEEAPVLLPQEMQLPIERMIPVHQQLYNRQFCTFCEYFLHFVQYEITDPKVEDEIRKTIDKACSKMPKSINETCTQFVDTYEPALVALLAQEIDPTRICPLIKVCPGSDVTDVEIFSSAESSSSCPLCLYAVTELESMVKNKKTKDDVKNALHQICNRLSANLKQECVDFVNTYTDELVEMLVADFKPQEVCVYLKLCTDSTPVSESAPSLPELSGGDVETNIIYDNTYNGEAVENLDDEKCILCEFIMKEVDDKLKDKKTDDEIKQVVHDICNVLPGTVKESCNNFVNQYADAIIILLQESMEPSSICSYLKLCSNMRHPLEFLRAEISKCGVCRSSVEIMKHILSNPKIDQNVEHIFEKTCRGLPSDQKKTCEDITTENGLVMVVSISRGNVDPDRVCRSLAYCSSASQLALN